MIGPSIASTSHSNLGPELNSALARRQATDSRMRRGRQQLYPDPSNPFKTPALLTQTFALVALYCPSWRLQTCVGATDSCRVMYVYVCVYVYVHVLRRRARRRRKSTYIFTAGLSPAEGPQPGVWSPVHCFSRFPLGL